MTTHHEKMVTEIRFAGLKNSAKVYVILTFSE